MCITLRTVNPSLDVHNPTDSQSCSLGKSPGARSLARTLWAFRVESTTYGGGRLCQGSEALALVWHGAAKVHYNAAPEPTINQLRPLPRTATSVGVPWLKQPFLSYQCPNGGLFIGPPHVCQSPVLFPMGFGQRVSQWWSADAEIKVPPLCPLHIKAWSRSENSHVFFAHCGERFLWPNLYLPGPFTFISSKSSPNILDML